MNEHLSLREIMKRVRQASLCPRCGKSTFVAATGWRGHGTGRGSSYYGATSFEQVTPETHCSCTPEQKAQAEKQARYEALCAKETLTREETAERVRLYYELKEAEEREHAD